MDINYFIQKHYKNRRKGFYCWTTKKNFLSSYIFVDYTNHVRINKNSACDQFKHIFIQVISKIKNENDEKLKKKCNDQWKSCQFRPMFHSNFFNNPIIFLNNAQPRHLFHFLYNNKWSIEEFFAYVVPHIDPSRLFKIALQTFSYIDIIIDDFCSMYVEKVYYPIGSLYTNNFLYYKWFSICLES